MPTPPYIELHCHSGYSFLDGASHPEELVLRAKELGYPALALTDHDGLYGSMEFARFAKAEGVQPITGVELTVWGWHPLERSPGNAVSGLPATTPRRVPTVAASWRPEEFEVPKTAGAYTSPPPPPAWTHGHLTLLAETPRGYANLSRLVSLAHLHSPRGTPALPIGWLLGDDDGPGRGAPRTDIPQVSRGVPTPEVPAGFVGVESLPDDAELTEGLICLTGCRRSPLLTLLDDSTASAEDFARRLLRALGPERLFVELQDHRIRGDARRNKALCRLADRLGIPVVATGNVHYARPEKHRLQDVLVAIRHRSTLDGSHDVRRGNALFALTEPERMARRFAGRPDAVTNTLRIAERCAAFDLTTDLGYAFPDFEGSDRGSAMQVLAEVCRAALDERYPERPAARASPQERRASKLRDEAVRRLETELELVERHGLGGFFLVYRDILELARKVAAELRAGSPRAGAGLPAGRGRGSSVSSIICYLIGLSHIDPVENDLFLGRFLNDALKSVPDIDIDFSRDIREELILRIYEKYGNEHAGLVCTFPTYRFRSTVREVGKVLELPAGELEKLSKLGGHHFASAHAVRGELAGTPEFAEKADAPLWQALMDLSGQIAGLPRHISQHVGGMIISSRPLLEMVPLEPAAWEGRVLCQWDKDSCDDAGFIKIDFLALGMLSLVEDAADLIAERHGAVPDLSRIDFNDGAVYDRICDGDTIGLFQVESRAQIQMVRRVRPRNLKDLAVQVAIVRPGPIVGGAVNPYVRRRELLREDPDFSVPYPHPLLEEALGETLGVIIFQDQVLKVCQALAGFTDGQAEGLRRAMSRKRSKEALVSYWEAFRDGAAANGVDETTAKEVFTQVVAFSEFGFPKSHAAAFGLLAYQSAWLRHYYPVEYTVALFNNQPMGFYSLDALGRDARRNGIRVLLPDLNRSGVRCTAEEDDLRVGLGFVRGWGEEIAAAVVAERERRGPFRGLPDFLRRTPAALKRPAIENLVWVGGMEEWGLSRRQLLWQVGLWLGPEDEEDRRKAGGREDHPQLELGLDDPFASIPFGELDDAEKLVAEYRMLRFSTERHPLSLLTGHLPPERVLMKDFDDLPDRSTVWVSGIVVARQKPGTAKGYVFVLMEDESGPINVIVKPDLYAKERSTIRLEPFLTVRGRLQKDGATRNVIAFEVRAIRIEGSGRSGTDVDDATLRPALPGTMEYWARDDRNSNSRSAYRYLTSLRSNPPSTKSWG